MLAFTLAGQYLQSLRAAKKIMRLVRVADRLEAHNDQLKRKLDMLSHKPWREKVLKDLGGLRKLKLWDAAKARIEARASAPKPEAKRKGPSWLYTPERIAESERLKARKRANVRAGHNPLIVRDRCKVDVEGDFRLAPLPRGERTARQIRVYTKNTIINYEFNPMPFQKEKGFGPASVWPVEFYAAMKIEAEILAARDSHAPVLPSPEVCSQTVERGSSRKEQHAVLDPLFRGDDIAEDREDRGNDRASAPTISIYSVLPLKVMHDLLTPIPGDAPHAGS